MATKNVNIDIIAKDKTQKAMQSATNGVNNLKNNVANSVQSQQRSFTALGSTIKTVLGGLAIIQTVRFAGEMVKITSAVEEMQSKSSVVFGKFVSDVRSELEEFGNQVGRSTFELEGMASSIQDTFVPMGFARGEASKLSVQLTKLAVDVASFNNASDTETMMAFQSALVGNHETVRRFGVVITEATLKQELLRMGINKTASEITNAEKVQARLNLIIAGTSDAHNDAIRTSGSFANQSKALASELEELKVNVMQPLLPVLTDIIKAMTEATKSTANFLTTIGIIPRNFEDTVRTATEINKLLKQRADLEKIIAEMTKPGLVLTKSAEEQLKIFKKQLEEKKLQIQAERDLLKLGDQRLRQQHQISDVVRKQIQKEKEVIKTEKEKQKIKDATLFSDASMGGVPVNAHLNVFSDAQRLSAIQDVANTELDLMKSINADKIKTIMENDELEVELARITADKKLQIAKETAEKQAEIQKKLLNDNFQLIKSGNAHEIKLDKLSDEQKTELAKKTGREALEQMAQNNRKAFALNKAFKIAEAISNTAQGVTKALSTTNIPLAIAIGALGAVQIAQIASTKYQGRRLGGRMNQGQPYMVGEAGPEMVVPDRPSNVVPNSKLPNAQPVTVNFNINTVDARGFNELLVNSRGTIVSLINGAVNEKGKMAII